MIASSAMPVSFGLPSEYHHLSWLRKVGFVVVTAHHSALSSRRTLWVPRNWLCCAFSHEPVR